MVRFVEHLLPIVAMMAMIAPMLFFKEEEPLRVKAVARKPR